MDTGDVAIIPDIDLSYIDEDKNGMVGFIHADGNAVGQLIMRMAAEAKNENANNNNGGTGREKFRAFSEGLAKATLAAAQHATEKVLRPKAVEKNGKWALPARPIVLGGDDLTIIVRADLAQEFTAVYLKAFEAQTKAAFDKLVEEQQAFKCLPTHLSAGAGIVYVSAKFPFDQCHELAEQIAGTAKTAAKEAAKEAAQDGAVPVPASTLLFHKMTFSLAGSHEQIKSDRMAKIGKDEIHLTAGPYRVDENAPQSIGAFNALYLALTDKDEKVYGLTKLREIVGLLQTNPNEAQRRYNRWVEVVRGNKNLEEGERFDDLVKLAQTFLGEVSADDNILLMAKIPNKEEHVCILADIIMLNSVGYLKSNKGENNEYT